MQGEFRSQAYRAELRKGSKKWEEKAGEQGERQTDENGCYMGTVPK